MELYEEVFEDVPEPEHVEQVFEGVIDTIAGNEGFTQAQSYLGGVLYSNGLMRREDISGTEGFLGKVSDAVKAGIEYIKKMFQSIWDFFFKKDKKRLSDECAKAINDTKKKVDEAKNFKVDPSEADGAVKKATTMVNGLKDSPEKTKLKQKLENVEDKSDSEKAAVLKALPGELFSASKLNTNDLQMVGAKIELNIKRLNAAKEGASVAPQIQAMINAVDDLPKAVYDVEHIEGAYAFLNKALAAEKAMESSLKGIESEESSYKSKIEAIERAEEKNGEELKKLKEAMTDIALIISVAKAILESIIKACAMINKSLVVII